MSNSCVTETSLEFDRLILRCVVVEDAMDAPLGTITCAANFADGR